MSSVIPEKFVLHQIYLTPPRLRDGSDRPVSKYSHLLNYELLLVLNGKPVGYTLNFAVPSNLTIDSYIMQGMRVKYTEGDISNMNDIFTLVELNGLYFIKSSSNANLALYFKLENLNRALLLDFFYQSYKPDTLLSRFIGYRLNDYTLKDIEANLFSYRNGQNIVALRAQNAKNYAYIIAKGDQLIADLRISAKYLRYLRSVTTDTLEEPTDVIVQPIPLWSIKT